MKFKTYIVARDYGFAPNPFGKYCTLACCKQKIREHLNVGDWIFGTGSKQKEQEGKLVFAMNITEKVTYQEYWDDPRFDFKKPIMNGSLMQMYGDNIYHFDDQMQDWIQENSHHSLPNGAINNLNLDRDLSGKYVLVSEHFFYFGRSAIKIPSKCKNDLCMQSQGHKNVDPHVALDFIDWLSKNYSSGKHDDPLLFEEQFERYDGK